MIEDIHIYSISRYKEREIVYTRGRKIRVGLAEDIFNFQIHRIYRIFDRNTRGGSYWING